MGIRTALREFDWKLAFVIALLPLSLALGLPQWFLIKRQVQKSAWWWLVARPFAWLMGIGLITLGDRLGILPSNGLFFPDLWEGSIIAAVFDFGFAAITGPAFAWIQTNRIVVYNHGE